MTGEQGQERFLNACFFLSLQMKISIPLKSFNSIYTLHNSTSRGNLYVKELKKLLFL